jgi:hypothetical protein
VFAGGFKRSGVFGLIGVFVVAAVVIVIATSTGEGQSNPKTTYALIFGVLAAFFGILMVLQRSDLNRVAGGDAKAVQHAVAEGRVSVDDPTRMPEQQLWASMAVKPIDDAAIKARGSMWESARRSQNLGVVVVILIFLIVPSIYLLESFVPLLIGGPLIILAALYGSFRALQPGGELDEGYAKVGTAMAPLGLEVTERPTVSIQTREATTGRVGPTIHGNLVLSGQRHGHAVSARLGGGGTSARSEVSVGAAVPRFKVKSRDGRVRPAEDTPGEIAAALANTPNSTRWKKMVIEGGPEGILVTRKGGDQGDWLCDLWLAEHLAAASRERPGPVAG